MRRVARLIVAAFCWTTAAYAFLSASAFTNQQFIRPRVFEWVGRFSDHHAWLYWPCLAIAVASVARQLRARGPLGWVARAFVAAWIAVGVWITARPILPTLMPDPRSLIVGLVALAPLVWLAAIDHLAAAPYLRRQDVGPSEQTLAATEARLLTASVGTAVFVALLYAVFTPLVMGGAFEPDLLTTGLTVGFAWNLLDHLLMLVALFLVLAFVERRAARLPAFWWRYLVDAVVITVLLAILAERLIGDAIGLTGAWGVAAAAGLSLSVVCTWAALRLRGWAAKDVPLRSGLDVLFAPASDGAVGVSLVVKLAGIAAAAYTFTVVAGRIDWDFLLLKVSVVIVWAMTFAVLYGATPAIGLSTRWVVVVCLIPLAAHALDEPLQARLPRWLGDPGSTIRHTLDRYRVYNAAFRFTDGVRHDRSDAPPSFERFIRANTGVDAQPIAPVAIDFVDSLQPTPARLKPLIFLFVVDSLRSDYLSPYNPAVTFTPRIAAFAADSLVFRNAFTRYGGTGLSMSAIWMGAAGVHKQYVEPFAPMNALEKLLDANGYRKYISRDHIMAELLTPSPSLVPLDRGVPELQFDFCRTVDEIERRLDADAPSVPVFAHTRSLNLHVAAITNGTVPAGETYPGFEARYASRVHRIDGCLGTFVDFLKRRRLYDRSIVMLMADHGEMLGEDRQWGHAYYLFPQVLRIPLIVHLPPALAPPAPVDVDATAFSTDVTPTLYYLLGYQPRRDTPLMGRPLVGPAAEFRDRRRGTDVVAASYGAVWGALARNGHRLYIVDANHGREYAYERPARGPWQAAPPEEMRAASQRAIRESIEEIGRVYRLIPAP